MPSIALIIMFYHVKIACYQCAREGLSDMLDERHMAARNGINFHHTAAIFIAIFLQIGRLAMELPDGGSSDSRSRSDGHGDVRS